MNRDIKFKIWDKEQKKFLEINWEGEDTRHTKGKEIYEKDIVKVTINNKTFNAWIVFEMGSFMIANDDITYYIDDNWNDNVKCLSELAWEQEEFEDRIYCLEVIGNTYQNINLIEV